MKNHGRTNLTITYTTLIERLIIVVLFAFLGDIAFTVKVKVNDSNGRILILKKEIDGTKYLLVNLYNANTEFEKVKIIISQFIAGHFNLFFNSKLESPGGISIFKNTHV